MKHSPEAMQKLAKWLDDEITRLTKENMSYEVGKDARASNIQKKYALVEVRAKVKELL